MGVKIQKMLCCLLTLTFLCGTGSAKNFAVDDESLRNDELDNTYLAETAVADIAGEISGVGKINGQKIELKLCSQHNVSSIFVVAASYSNSKKMISCEMKKTAVSINGTDIQFEMTSLGDVSRVFILDDKYRPCGTQVDIHKGDVYFVTFADYDGRVLSVQIVPCGGDAIAPPNPQRTGYSFVGWDKSYANISSDVVLTARYVEGAVESSTVIFYDDDGTTILKKATDVPYGGYVIPPSDPAKNGAVFLGWSGQYANVTESSTVRAVYDDAKNVFQLSSAEGSMGDTVTVLFSLKGTVKTCGFDLNIMYDEDLELVSYDDDLDMDIVVNPDVYSTGVKLNYSGTRDVTREREVVQLTFRIKAGAKSAMPVWITMNSIYEIESNDPVSSDYHAVGSIILLK